MSTTFNNARKCLRCGWEWIIRRKSDMSCNQCNAVILNGVFLHARGCPALSEPKRCPRCRSEKWNQEQEPKRA